MTEREIAASLTAMRDTVEGLERGLRKMLDIEETHSEMLRRLLIAAAEPEKDEQELNQLIKQLIATLNIQSDAIMQLRGDINGLADTIGTGVATAVRRVLSEG